MQVCSRGLFAKQQGARSALEWEELLNAHGIPAGRILSVPEILAHPQIAARNLIHEIPMGLPGLETVKVCRAGYSLDDGQPGARSAPPLLGADNAEIFGALGRDAGDLARLQSAGAI